MVLTSPVALYIAKPFNNRSYVRLLDARQVGAGNTTHTLFKEVPEGFTLAHTIVDTVEDADFIIVPQAIKKLTSAHYQYLLEISSFAKSVDKKILIFLSGDYCHRIHIPFENMYVFKASVYRHQRTKNEIVFAPFVEDLGHKHGQTFRSKSKLPTISFCGYAGLKSIRAHVKFYLETFWFDLTNRPIYKRGIWWRKKAMRILTEDTRLHTSFIIRSSFSGNSTTASKDADSLRREYVENIITSDFVLCPKGDANYSSRFYETLSLGRIPVVIDTDMVLPFENQIDYSACIIRVPYQEVNRVGDYIMERWEKMTDQDFERMQEAARNAFVTYLRYDAYFNTALPKLKEQGIAGVV